MTIDLEPLYATRPLWSAMADCPFCHGEAEAYSISVSYSTNVDGALCDYFGECAECGASGPRADTPEHAMGLWDNCDESRA